MPVRWRGGRGVATRRRAGSAEPTHQGPHRRPRGRRPDVRAHGHRRTGTCGHLLPGQGPAADLMTAIMLRAVGWPAICAVTATAAAVGACGVIFLNSAGPQLLRSEERRVG